MQYFVVSGETNQVLVKAVNQYLAEGWTLAGGVAVVNFSGRPMLLQAIIREESPLQRGNDGVFPDPPQV